MVVTAEDVRKAVEYYQQAIEIDPQSALTYAGLAHCLVLMGAGEYGLRGAFRNHAQGEGGRSQGLEN